MPESSIDIAAITAGSDSSRALAKELNKLSDDELIELVKEGEGLAGIRWQLAKRIADYADGDALAQQGRLMKGSLEIEELFINELRFSLNRLETGADDDYYSAVLDGLKSAVSTSDREPLREVASTARRALDTESAIQRQQAETQSAIQGSQMSSAVRDQREAEREAFGAQVNAVANLGVNPQSPEGVAIQRYLETPGTSIDDELIQEYVNAYRKNLVGPVGSTPAVIRPRGGRPGGDRALDDAAEQPTNLFGYTAGQEFSELDRMNTGMIARTQERLVAIGLLDEGYVRGKADPVTQQAMLGLLELSNIEQRSWQDTLRTYERRVDETGLKIGESPDGGGGGTGRVFRPAPYLAPDYASIAQDVKSVLRQQLNRDPDESELANLTAELTGWHKEAYDAEVAAQRSQFEGTGGSTTVQAVDPAARFQEFFESRYAPEIDLVEDKEEADVSRAVVESGSEGISDMSRRGY